MTHRTLDERLRLAPDICNIVARWTSDPLAERTLGDVAALLCEVVNERDSVRDALVGLSATDPQAPTLDDDPDLCCGDCKHWSAGRSSNAAEGAVVHGLCGSGMVPGYARARRNAESPHRETCFEPA